MTGMRNRQTLAKNLRHQMELANVRAKDVCEALHLPFPTFSDWTNAKSYPRIDRIELLASYFGVSKMDLIEEPSYGLSAALSAEVVSFPVVTKLGPIPVGCEIMDVPASYLGEKSVENFVAIKVKDAAMYPDYRENDIVLIEKDSAVPSSAETLCIACENLEIQLRTVLFSANQNEITLLSANPAIPPVQLTGKSVKSLQILGRPKYMLRTL